MKTLPTQILNNRLLVKPLPGQEQVKNKIIIPETANANLAEGEVVMFDHNLQELVKAGDIAIYPSGSGVGQFVEGVAHLWLRIEEVWAIDKPKSKLVKA